METLGFLFCGSLKRYVMRRQYKRLRSRVTTRKYVKISRVRGSGRSFRKIRVAPKLRVKITSPIKVLERLRDAYVNMMLCLAGNMAQLNNGNVFLVRRIPNAPQISASQEAGFRSPYKFK